MSAIHVLNESQRRAAEHRDGPLMVLAGPGSGKTTVITHRALHLITKCGVTPAHILIITYSKAASEQMRVRFEALAEQSGVDTGITFGTFHAVFFRILRARYGYRAEQLLKEDERRQAVKKFLTAAGYSLEEDFLTQVLNELSLVKNELYDLRFYHSAVIGADDFKSIYDQYENYKSEKDKLDFDDMLTRCYALLKNEPENLAQWRKRFRYVMIDEFQDINRVQYECVKLLTMPEGNLFIVGDDDQSIYRFRGARPEFLLNFPHDFPQTGRVVLDMNYRSADPIISYSNNLIAENRIRYGKHIVGTNKTGPSPVMLTADDQNQEAAAIAGRIKAMQKQGRDLNEIAVIYRLNLQARAFVDAFMQVNLPYQVKDEISVIYEHWMAQDIFAYLRLSRQLPRTYDPDTERIINKPYRYVGKAFLLSAKKAGMSLFDAYRRDPTLRDGSRARIEELLLDLRYIGKMQAGDAVRHIRQQIGYDQYIQDHCQYRKLDPSGLFEIANELQDAAKQFATVEAYLSHAAEAITAARESKQTHTARITLTTMHSAKGLEFDTVFITGAVEGVIPHERSKTEAELEEERRLLYVGVTRARQDLYISVPKTRYEKPVKPSRFIRIGR